MLTFVRILVAIALAGIVVVSPCSVAAQAAPAATIADAKRAGDGDPVSLVGKAVTYAARSFFYIQEDARNCGIRVQMSGHGLAAGMRADVTGSIATNDHQERIILATFARHNGDFTMKPLLLRGSSVGGGDWHYRGSYGQRGVTGSTGLNNIGLLAKVHGRYEQIDPTTFVLDDGSGQRIKCSVPTGYVLHPDWQYVSATGVVSMESQDDGVYSPVVAVGNLEALAPQPLLELHVHCIRVSDDDGSRQANVTPAQIQQWVDFANTTYALAQIHFLYDPAADFTDIQSTLINNMAGTGDYNWNQEKAAANQYAAAYPNKVVFFCLWGPGANPTGGGFSWTDYNFIAMPGFGDATHCGHPHYNMLAHEVGHYMGLSHTFAGDPFAIYDDAYYYFVNHGSDPAVFDGDGLSDTAPDPSIRTMECDGVPTVTFNDTDLVLPRTNIMSYYEEAAEASHQQIDRARWFLAQRMAHGMSAPNNSGVANPIEAETMQIVWTVSCSLFPQDMSPWGTGNWSAGNQLFGVCSNASSFALGLPVGLAKTYRIDMYATYAPDYGKVQGWLDGSKIGSVFDGYGPTVAPSGRITLGNAYLTPGSHQLGFTVTGKHALSSGYFLGLDCFELVPVL
ncbi:MAG: hypothetical protein A2Z18_04330 [Armatimonadetes bacterium RBG_16_58_9]|nr:MAG: hypothetical protein A2Z18_04330 [Armatimonadetes bacterium RBG_16_58_9]